ncbi:MAG: caspase family protein [Chloroflexi bacterium]|nr:caspase family protein [Chloroflexota bacterium]
MQQLEPSKRNRIFRAGAIIIVLALIAGFFIMRQHAAKFSYTGVGGKYEEPDGNKSIVAMLPEYKVKKTEKPSTAHGYALLVGLTSVDPGAYGGYWDGTSGCAGCENDVENMKEILSPLGYEIKSLETEAATRGNILNALDDAVRKLQPGDIFVFYYTGHTGQIKDTNGDEEDRKDEILKVYDGPVIDDELNDRWIKIKNDNVRIVMISDSCNAGTSYKILTSFKQFTPAEYSSSKKMKAQFIFIGGCPDGEESRGDIYGGYLTLTLKETWNDGSFAGGYREFFDNIHDQLSYQNPQYKEYGPVSDGFRKQKPFTIE